MARKKTIELFISRIQYPITEYEDFTTTRIPRKTEYEDFTTDKIPRKTEYEDFTTEQNPRKTKYEDFTTKHFLSDTILEENPTGDIFKPFTANRADNSDNLSRRWKKKQQTKCESFLDVKRSQIMVSVLRRTTSYVTTFICSQRISYVKV
jgi:hypothetical protein